MSQQQVHDNCGTEVERKWIQSKTWDIK